MPPAAPCMAASRRRATSAGIFQTLCGGAIVLEGSSGLDAVLNCAPGSRSIRLDRIGRRSRGGPAVGQDTDGMMTGAAVSREYAGFELRASGRRVERGAKKQIFGRHRQNKRLASVIIAIPAGAPSGPTAHERALCTWGASCGGGCFLFLSWSQEPLASRRDVSIPQCRLTRR